MDILITGTSDGIGRATAEYFLARGHSVVGFDRKPPALAHPNYRHEILDICDADAYPEDVQPEILINNAGVQDSGRDIEINLMGTIRITEKYAIANPRIRAVVMVGSASAHTGSEFPEYAASKGGLLTYTKNAALRLAPRARRGADGVEPTGDGGSGAVESNHGADAASTLGDAGGNRGMDLFRRGTESLHDRAEPAD